MARTTFSREGKGKVCTKQHHFSSPVLGRKFPFVCVCVIFVVVVVGVHPVRGCVAGNDKKDNFFLDCIYFGLHLTRGHGQDKWSDKNGSS